jgi:hypothetical protein
MGRAVNQTDRIPNDAVGITWPWGPRPPNRSRARRRSRYRALVVAGKKRVALAEQTRTKPTKDAFAVISEIDNEHDNETDGEGSEFRRIGSQQCR